MYTREMWDKLPDLMKLPKAELVRRVRTYWGWSATPPERWTKEELAKDIVSHEDGVERYEAYGRVALVNGMPDRPGSKCGGTGCEGHVVPTLWDDAMRKRHREQLPCVGEAGEQWAAAPCPRCGESYAAHQHFARQHAYPMPDGW